MSPPRAELRSMRSMSSTGFWVGCRPDFSGFGTLKMLVGLSLSVASPSTTRTLSPTRMSQRPSSSREISPPSPISMTVVCLRPPCHLCRLPFFQP
ncbi:hypothetical protein D3C75_654000 [compost metagenome]